MLSVSPGFALLEILQLVQPLLLLFQFPENGFHRIAVFCLEAVNQVQALLHLPETLLVQLHMFQIGGRLPARVAQYGFRVVELIPDAV